MTEPPRVKAIKAELDKTAKEYLVAKQALDIARITFESARERYSGLKKHANSILQGTAWYEWQYNHRDVQYAATQIGSAIADVLWNHAFMVSYECSKNNSPYDEYEPSMSIQEIASALEEGGFDFRSTTPMREVNAALIQLKNVVKLESGDYQIEDAKSIYDDLNEDTSKKKNG